MKTQKRCKKNSLISLKKIKENNTKQTEYFLNGNLKSQCTRKEVSKLKRIFSKCKNRWYEYQCHKFDSFGNKIAFIKFNGNNFSNWNIYPENLTEIKASQFSTIIIYVLFTSIVIISSSAFFMS